MQTDTETSDVFDDSTTPFKFYDYVEQPKFKPPSILNCRRNIVVIAQSLDLDCREDRQKYIIDKLQQYTQESMLSFWPVRSNTQAIVGVYFPILEELSGNFLEKYFYAIRSHAGMSIAATIIILPIRVEEQMTWINFISTNAQSHGIPIGKLIVLSYNAITKLVPQIYLTIKKNQIRMFRDRGFFSVDNENRFLFNFDLNEPILGEDGLARLNDEEQAFLDDDYNSFSQRLDWYSQFAQQSGYYKSYISVEKDFIKDPIIYLSTDKYYNYNPVSHVVEKNIAIYAPTIGGNHKIGKSVLCSIVNPILRIIQSTFNVATKCNRENYYAEAAQVMRDHKYRIFIFTSNPYEKSLTTDLFRFSTPFEFHSASVMAAPAIDHVLSPKVRLVEANTTSAFLEEIGCEQSQLPPLRLNDPIQTWHQGGPGRLFVFDRYNPASEINDHTIFIRST